jgi:hypothetical protein
LKAPSPQLPAAFGVKNYPPATNYEAIVILFCFVFVHTIDGAAPAVLAVWQVSGIDLGSMTPVALMARSSAVVGE